MNRVRDRAPPEVLPLAKEIYMQMLVIDPQERASIQQVMDSPAFKQLLELYPQEDNRILYHNGKY